MILAYPINKDKKPIGPEKAFKEEQWAVMKKLPNLRWVELPKVEEESEYSNINSMTKRELVEMYGLDTEDMKLKKSEIIKKITDE